jgi:peptidoglycan/LPS O-acetylase OafA/YrhL
MRIASGRSPTLAETYEASQYRPSGFDYMRIVLSVAVIFAHSIDVSYGEAVAIRVWDTPIVGVMKLVLPMFFVLSGFLIAGSMERCRSLVSFLGLRALRIYPALVVEVVLSAFLVGPLVTHVPLGAYFTDPKFFHYLLNITGYISYELPGVFAGNPTPDTVNMQLWTVPWELIGYASMAILILAGMKKHRVVALTGLVAWLIADAIQLKLAGELRATFGIYHDVHSGGKLMILFLLGVAAFLYRERIPYSATLFWPSLIFSLVAPYCVPAADYLTLLPLTYVTLYLGLANPKRLGFIGLADYSYGIYLYGWVFQQFVADWLPWSRHWYLNIALSLPLACLAGVVSWYGVEKPMQRFKKPLRIMEDRWLTLKSNFMASGQDARS